MSGGKGQKEESGGEELIQFEQTRRKKIEYRKKKI